MFTSLLYHTWGIRGCTYVHTRYERGNTTFRVRQNGSSLRSSCCGSRKVVKRGMIERTFRAVPVGTRSIFIEAALQRVECLECTRVRQVDIPFVSPHLRVQHLNP